VVLAISVKKILTATEIRVDSRAKNCLLIIWRRLCGAGGRRTLEEVSCKG